MTTTSIETGNRAASQALLTLRVGFFALPLLFGIDKFANVLTSDWTRYLAHEFTDASGMSAGTAMHVVGMIEIVAGLVVLATPRLGAPLVAVWLAGIIVNLLMVGGYGDVALRDFGLFVAALTLARLAWMLPDPVFESLRRR